MRKTIAQQENGQIMLLAVMVLSTGILSASIVAGTIVLFQLRQAINVKESTKAAYAADAGLECELYMQFKAVLPLGTPCDTVSGASITCGTDAEGSFCQLTNGAKFRVVRTGPLPLPDIKSIGESGRATRAFEVNFTQI